MHSNFAVLLQTQLFFYSLIFIDKTCRIFAGNFNVWFDITWSTNSWAISRTDQTDNGKIKSHSHCSFDLRNFLWEIFPDSSSAWHFFSSGLIEISSFADFSVSSWSICDVLISCSFCVAISSFCSCDDCCKPLIASFKLWFSAFFSLSEDWSFFADDWRSFKAFEIWLNFVWFSFNFRAINSLSWMSFSLSSWNAEFADFSLFNCFERILFCCSKWWTFVRRGEISFLNKSFDC